MQYNPKWLWDLTASAEISLCFVESYLKKKKKKNL